jgi:hypothetical protein
MSNSELLLKEIEDPSPSCMVEGLDFGGYLKQRNPVLRPRAAC